MHFGGCDELCDITWPSPGHDGTLNNLVGPKLASSAAHHFQHPRVMSDWMLPVKLIAMDAPNAYRILDYLDRNRTEVNDLVSSLERWDQIDFAAMLDTNPEATPMVMELFKRALPTVHWYYLFETMFETMQKNLGMSSVTPSRARKTIPPHSTRNPVF